MINKCTLIGRIGKDLEISFTPNGLAVVKFSLATSESRQVDGDWKTKTTWHNIVMFGKQVESAEKRFAKGMLVYIDGKIDNSESEQDGVKRYYSSIIANYVSKMPTGESKSQPVQSNATHVVNNSAPVPDNSEESLPF